MLDSLTRQIFAQIDSDEPNEAWSEFLREYASLIFNVIRRFESDPDRASDCFQFVCERLVERRFRRLRKFNPNGPAKFSTWLRAVVHNLCRDWHRKQFGRRRVFQSIKRLSTFDQEVFRLIYLERSPVADCRIRLQSKFNSVTAEQIEESCVRIQESLTSQQRWILDAGAGRENSANLGDEFDSLPNVADSRADPETQAIASERSAKLKHSIERLPATDRLLLRLRFGQDLTLEQCARLSGLKNAQQVDRRIKQILQELRIELS